MQDVKARFRDTLRSYAEQVVRDMPHLAGNPEAIADEGLRRLRKDIAEGAGPFESKRLSLSYEQITPMEPEELKRMATEGLLDDATLERIAHLGRFFARIGKLAGDAKVGDAFTDEELDVIWRDTADPSETEIGHHPLIH